ncbi:MAG: MFS transporter, partial [Dehalococcoidia bacterium]|nr:MFS transporter [Dehalococcoidia bacterium]
MVGIGTQAIPTLSAIMVVRLLGSAALAGIGTSLVGAGRFLVSYPIGKITDTYGRKAGRLLGLSIGLVGSLLIGGSMALLSFPLFVVGVLVFGMGMAGAQQLRVAAADMYPPSRRAEGLGWVLTGSVLGALGGPVLISGATAVAEAIRAEPLALTWAFVPLVILPGIVLVFRVHPDPKEIASNLAHYYPGYTPPIRPPAPAGGETVGLVAFLRDFPKLAAFVASFAVFGNMSMMMAMTSLTLHQHGYALPTISVSVAIHVVGMFGFSLPIGRLADRVGRRRVMLLGLALAGAGSVLVPATSLYWTITLGTFLVGVGWSCVNVAASALLADTTSPAERGRAIGTNDTFSAVASITMPLVAGPVVEYLAFSALSLVGVGLMVPPL